MIYITQSELIEWLQEQLGQDAKVTRCITYFS